jgi:hypothetical protein
LNYHLIQNKNYHEKYNNCVGYFNLDKPIRSNQSNGSSYFKSQNASVQTYFKRTPRKKERKKDIVNTLKSHVMEKQNLENGFKYKFKEVDDLLDRLTTFIKLERQCCNFLEFTIFVSGGSEYLWLAISGPDGVKDFINEELGL